MKIYIRIILIICILLSMGYYYVIFLLPLSLTPLPSSTIFIDVNHQEIGEVIFSGSIRHQDISFEEIPDFYKKSLIALEDRTFYSNNGISLRGVLRSALRNIQAFQIIEGGTTLSSGLIRNALWIQEDRTLKRKIGEFLYALRLNQIYSKDQILTEYINRVNFGYLNYGLKSAAKYYFNRTPNDLTKAEQIALLVLPKDPKKYDPYNKPKLFQQRFHHVVTTLQKTGIITMNEQEDILRETLIWNMDHSLPLPYVLDFLKTQSRTHHATTFDRSLTEQIEVLAKNTLRELSWRNVTDYGILIAERSKTNPLLRVMIGGENYQDPIAGQVNTTLAKRQPGSTIKPFTYALAFDKLGFTPETTILDFPIAYKTSENYAYEPKNYTLNYKGEISLRQALSESVNIPAIKLAEQIGLSSLLEFLRKAGMSSLREDVDHYGLGLTLGNGETSLYELLQAYTIFTNQGSYCPFQIFSPLSRSLRERETIKDKTISPLLLGEAHEGNTPGVAGWARCTQVINSKYTDMVVSILSDRYAKIGDFPLNSALDFENRIVAVKTGTSRNFRDNWAVGFINNYMIGVWTGNKSGENMKGVSGATGAGEIFRRIVYALEKEDTKKIPWKIAAQTQPYLTITNPLAGSVYKMDTEGKKAKQKIHLHFETNIPYDTSIWMFNGIEIPGDFLDLKPGNHEVEAILMKDGEILQKKKSVFQIIGGEI